MPDQREDVLKFMRLNGPCLPVQIAKILNTNILFASAILSELVARKQVLMSYAAIGGSKLYYLKGQDALLLERLSKTFKGKEKEACELLRNTKLLRDTTLEPWQRVAFKILKDIAVPITVTVGEKAELFWHYRTLNDTELETTLNTLLTPLQTIEPLQSPAINPHAQTQTLIETPPPTPPQPAIQQPEEPKPFAKEALQQAMANLKQELMNEMRPQFEQEKQKKKIPKETKSEKRFYLRVLDYLKKNNIEILKEEMIKKDKEFDFLIKIPTSLGALLYYLKAKDKKAINEAEISLAYSEGQLKKLPTIFLVSGKTNKKAQTFLEQKLQGQLHIKELD